MYERCFSILKFPVLILFIFVDVIYPQINPLKPPFQIKYAKNFSWKIREWKAWNSLDGLRTVLQRGFIHRFNSAIKMYALFEYGDSL